MIIFSIRNDEFWQLAVLVAVTGVYHPLVPASPECLPVSGL
jgi:hypothetical protein